MGVMRGVFVVLLFVACAAPAADLSVLPEGRNNWCCDSEMCFAVRDVAGLPECLNIWEYGSRAYGFDQGHKIDGAFVSCETTVRKAIASDPDAVTKHIGASFNYSGNGDDHITSCLPMWRLEARPTAYVFTDFDKRDERQEFVAYRSEYFCEQHRDLVKREDAISKISSCTVVQAR
jgi:hypothetical protein